MESYGDAQRTGGLGVGDIIIKNAVLLLKFWWGFSFEERPLWKRIVSSCNELDLETPIWKQTSSRLGRSVIGYLQHLEN